MNAAEKAHKWISQYHGILELVERISKSNEIKDPYTRDGAEKIAAWYKDCRDLFSKCLESEHPDQAPGYAIIALMDKIKEKVW